jgi:hypothetical protein
MGWSALGRRTALTVRRAGSAGVSNACIAHDVNPHAYLHRVVHCIVHGWPQAKLHDLLPDRMLADYPELHVGDPDALPMLLSTRWRTDSPKHERVPGAIASRTSLVSGLRRTGGQPRCAREESLRSELPAHLSTSRGNVAQVARDMGKARMQIHRWCRRSTPRRFARDQLACSTAKACLKELTAHTAPLAEAAIVVMPAGTLMTAVPFADRA